MPFPTFSKAGVPTVILSRGDVYPTRLTVTPRQRVATTNAGAVQVATYSPEETQHRLSFVDMPTADRTALLAFLRNALINWAAFTFTYTDVNAATYTVRYLSGMLDWQETAPGLWDGDILLREEIV